MFKFKFLLWRNQIEIAVQLRVAKERRGISFEKQLKKSAKANELATIVIYSTFSVRMICVKIEKILCDISQRDALLTLF